MQFLLTKFDFQLIEKNMYSSKKIKDSQEKGINKYFGVFSYLEKVKKGNQIVQLIPFNSSQKSQGMKSRSKWGIICYFKNENYFASSKLQFQEANDLINQK